IERGDKFNTGPDGFTEYRVASVAERVRCHRFPRPFDPYPRVQVCAHQFSALFLLHVPQFNLLSEITRVAWEVVPDTNLNLQGRPLRGRVDKVDMLAAP